MPRLSTEDTSPPRLRPWRRLILCTLAAVLACSGPLDLPPGEASPYVQALLDPSASLQYIWVTRGSPADSAIDYSTRPVDAALVDLCLGKAGDSCIAAVSSSKPGRYEVPLSVLPGSTYVLGGQVEGSTLSGSVTLPGTLTVTAPTGDTLHLSGAFGTEVQYRWYAAGTARYGATLQGKGGTTVQALHDTSGALDLFRFSDTMQLDIRGYEPHAAGFLLSATPAFSLQGIPGFLGGVTAARHYVVIWSD